MPKTSFQKSEREENLIKNRIRFLIYELAEKDIKEGFKEPCSENFSFAERAVLGLPLKGEEFFVFWCSFKKRISRKRDAALWLDLFNPRKFMIMSVQLEVVSFYEIKSISGWYLEKSRNSFLGKNSQIFEVKKRERKALAKFSVMNKNSLRVFF